MELHPERHPDDECAEYQDHAHRCAVTGVALAQVEAADLTALAYFQQVPEQPAAAAAWAAAGQRRLQD